MNKQTAKTILLSKLPVIFILMWFAWFNWASDNTDASLIKALDSTRPCILFVWDTARQSKQLPEKDKKKGKEKNKV